VLFRSELLSSKFKTAIRNAMASTKPVIGTIHFRSTDPLLDEIRSGQDIKIVAVTLENRTSLPAQIVEEVGN
jgi:nucleoside-triphosphatase